MKIKTLSEYIEDTAEQEIYVIAQVPYETSIFEKEKLIVEGKWVPSGYKDFWQRLDTPNHDFEQLHVHITHQKNIAAKNKQVSWNVDGSRHDKKSFDVNFKGLGMAKTIAEAVLKLPDNAVLENRNSTDLRELIFESVNEENSISEIYLLELEKD